MAQFLVITIEGDDVPPIGGTGHAVVYRGDHTDAATAVIAASEALNVQSGKRLWAIPAAAASRFRNTTTVEHTAATD